LVSRAKLVYQGLNSRPFVTQRTNNPQPPVQAFAHQLRKQNTHNEPGESPIALHKFGSRVSDSSHKGTLADKIFVRTENYPHLFDRRELKLLSCCLVRFSHLISARLLFLLFCMIPLNELPIEAQQEKVLAQSTASYFLMGNDFFGNTVWRINVDTRQVDEYSPSDTLIFKIITENQSRAILPSHKCGDFLLFDISVANADENVQLLHNGVTLQLRSAIQLTSSRSGTTVLMIDPNVSTWDRVDFDAKLEGSFAGGVPFDVDSRSVLRLNPKYLPKKWRHLVAPDYILTDQSDIDSISDEAVENILDAVRMGQHLVIRTDGDSNVVDFAKLGRFTKKLPSHLVNKQSELVEKTLQITQAIDPYSLGSSSASHWKYRSLAIEYGLGHIHFISHFDDGPHPFYAEYGHLQNNFTAVDMLGSEPLPKIPERNLAEAGGKWVAQTYALLIVPILVLTLWQKKNLPLFCVAGPAMALGISAFIFVAIVIIESQKPTNHSMAVTWIDSANGRSATYVRERIDVPHHENEIAGLNDLDLGLMPTDDMPYRYRESNTGFANLVPGQIPRQRSRYTRRLLFWLRSGKSDRHIDVQLASNGTIESIGNSLGGEALILAVSVDGKSWQVVQNLPQDENTESFTEMAADSAAAEIAATFQQKRRIARESSIWFPDSGTFLERWELGIVKLKRQSIGPRRFFAVVSNAPSIFQRQSKLRPGFDLELVMGTW
jgi:hypothetical protein